MMNDGSTAAGIGRNENAKACVVVAGPALVALIPMAAAPALPAMAVQFAAEGDGALFAQLVMTIPAVMVILAAPLMGYLAERIGRRLVLLSCLFLFTLSGACVMLLSDPWLLIGSRLVLGVAGGGLLTISFALAGDFQGHLRERVLGFAGAGAALMAIVAMIAGGHLVDLLGWRGPFILYLLGLPVVFLGWFAVARHRAVERIVSDVKFPMGSLWPLYLLTIMLTIGLFMPGIQGPFLLEADGVESATTRGLVLSAYSLVAAIAAGSFGYLRRRLEPKAVLVLTALALGVGSLVMATAHGVLGLTLGCVITGIGAGLVEPITVSMILSRAPEPVRARAVGLLLSAVFLGQFLNPLAVGPLRTLYGIHGAFFGVGLIFVGLAVVLWLLKRKRADSSVPVPSNSEL